jgi:hypothetical protein
MEANTFFAESQTQFTETQQKLTEIWDESQKELMESQKKLVDAWVDSLPKAGTQVDFAGSVDKALAFQRELVNSTMNAQQVAFRFAMESQKQFWDNYFQTTQRMAQTVPAAK